MSFQRYAEQIQSKLISDANKRFRDVLIPALKEGLPEGKTGALKDSITAMGNIVYASGPDPVDRFKDRERVRKHIRTVRLTNPGDIEALEVAGEITNEVGRRLRRELLEERARRLSVSRQHRSRAFRSYRARIPTRNYGKVRVIVHPGLYGYINTDVRNEWQKIVDSTKQRLSSNLRNLKV